MLVWVHAAPEAELRWGVHFKAKLGAAEDELSAFALDRAIITPQQVYGAGCVPLSYFRRKGQSFLM